MSSLQWTSCPTTGSCAHSGTAYSVMPTTASRRPPCTAIDVSTRWFFLIRAPITGLVAPWSCRPHQRGLRPSQNQCPTPIQRLPSVFLGSPSKAGLAEAAARDRLEPTTRSLRLELTEELAEHPIKLCDDSALFAATDCLRDACLEMSSQYDRPD